MEWIESDACLDRPSSVLPARLRNRHGSVCEINVLDISLAGCLIERRALSVSVGERALIRLADLGFLPGTIAWVEEEEVGLVFEAELYEPVLDRLKRSFVKAGPGPMR
jgi:hypothetical protein